MVERRGGSWLVVDCSAVFGRFWWDFGMEEGGVGGGGGGWGALVADEELGWLGWLGWKLAGAGTLLANDTGGAHGC